MHCALSKLFSPSGACQLKYSNCPTYMKTSEAPISTYCGTCQNMLKVFDPSQLHLTMAGDKVEDGNGTLVFVDSGDEVHEGNGSMVLVDVDCELHPESVDLAVAEAFDNFVPNSPL
ncbi:hypothetical protein L1987_01040 [Smallanthus sonchifolius]|uniref:Uncharacterized protein n=1 Tax=Smallanthus sonchifolius TaxID=185202 RepID=A0ACB9K3X8_9ASTR|nr:hypothetical protein L1987_01040 [Smallanthus sonchifolius]